MSLSTLGLPALSPPDLASRPAASTSTLSQASAKITGMARDFESILLGQWLQGAESSFGSVPGADDDTDQSDEQMKSFAVQSLAKHFSATGGIGVGKMVERALEASSSNTEGLGATAGRVVLTTAY